MNLCCISTDWCLVWARMPRWEKKTNKEGESELIPLRDRNTRVNMPMTRFREKKGTIAGGDREGTAEIMAGLLAFYRQHGFDPIATGSVKSFPRDLKPWEIKEVRLGNAARFRHRAGNRALDEEKRDDRYEKMLKSIENGKRKQTAKDGGDIGKRRLDEEPSDFPHSSPRTQKRTRRGQEVDAGLATWDEQYADQRDPATFQGHQYGEGMQGSPHYQQNNFPQTSAGFNPFEAQAPQPNMPTQTPSIQPNFSSDQAYSPLNPGQDGLYGTGSGDMKMLTASYPNYGPPGPQHNSPGNRGGPVYSPYHNMMPNDPMPYSGLQYNTPGYTNPSPYGPPTTPVQQQQPYGRANAPSQHTGRNLGPGGRGLYQMPKQVLGKRGERDVDGAGYGESQRGPPAGMEATRPAPTIPPAISNGTHQQKFNIQYTSDSEINSPLKRRRHNETAVSQPRPHRHRPEPIHGPRYYGADGAPTPLLSPSPYQEFFDISQPNPYSNTKSRVPPEIPDQWSRKISGTPGGVNRNENMRQGMSDAPSRRSGPIRPVSNIYETQQMLGKRGRGKEEAYPQEGLYMPQQNLGQQGPTAQPYLRGPNFQMPPPKRRLLPRTEGYYAPPAQTPTAQVVNKARNAERGAHLPPSHFRISEPTSNSHNTPQVEGVRPTPTNYIYSNEMPRNVGKAPQVTNGRGSDVPQMPTPRQSDIREVRPATADEAQSLYNALQYTRDAYFEWTGEEAPVTNLEDCYATQYREIKAAFRVWWDSAKNPRRLDPTPALRWVRRWSGALEDWEPPEDE